MKIFVATHNAHKLREIKEILPGFEVVADDPGGVEENAPDFAGNALLKLRAVSSRHPGEWCMADDSGLEVRALGGAPGVRSARYAGEPCDTAANNALLLSNLEGVEDRKAAFTCAVALSSPSGEEISVCGKCNGAIAPSPSGAAGFGYDPLFIPDGFDKSFAELSADEKNAISHRGRALAAAKEEIAKRSAAPAAARRRGGLRAWLSLFRAVNLPTVPGDVFAGAAAALACAATVPGVVAAFSARSIAAAALASVFAYMFALADNDIAGAATDSARRPIPAGEISLRAARIARAVCCVLVAVCGVAGALPRQWWIVAFSILVSAVAYNRLKTPALMGACRGLDVVCGAAAVASAAAGPAAARLFAFAGIPAAVAFAYVWWVTKVSEGEETDESKRANTGFLVGAVVYLQLAALVVFALIRPQVAAMRPLLIAGAVMLAALRAAKTLMPEVSAS